jgi:nicotinate phosphoribosyltransferase
MRRRGADGVAEAEVVGIGTAPTDDGDDRPLLVQLVQAGQRVHEDSLANARTRHAASLQELPPSACQLSRGEPVIPTIYEERP